MFFISANSNTFLRLFGVPQSPTLEPLVVLLARTNVVLVPFTPASRSRDSPAALVSSLAANADDAAVSCSGLRRCSLHQQHGRPLQAAAARLPDGILLNIIRRHALKTEYYNAERLTLFTAREHPQMTALPLLESSRLQHDE